MLIAPIGIFYQQQHSLASSTGTTGSIWFIKTCYLGLSLLPKLIVQRHMSGTEIIDINYNINILYISF